VNVVSSRLPDLKKIPRSAPRRDLFDVVLFQLAMEEEEEMDDVVDVLLPDTVLLVLSVLSVHIDSIVCRLLCTTNGFNSSSVPLDFSSEISSIASLASVPMDSWRSR
jgi:hypothetical protein